MGVTRRSVSSIMSMIGLTGLWNFLIMEWRDGVFSFMWVRNGGTEAKFGVLMDEIF